MFFKTPTYDRSPADTSIATQMNRDPNELQQYQSRGGYMPAEVILSTENHPSPN